MYGAGHLFQSFYLAAFLSFFFFPTPAKQE